MDYCMSSGLIYSQCQWMRKEILAGGARETGHLPEWGRWGINYTSIWRFIRTVFTTLQIEVKISTIQGVDEITSCPLGVGLPYCSYIKQAVRSCNGNLIKQLVLNLLIRLSEYQVYYSSILTSYCVATPSQVLKTVGEKVILSAFGHSIDYE